MSDTLQQSPELTKHQRRVLAALLALERTHDLRWWDRESIGHVVAAGGYHDVIQRQTIAKLKQLGLVQTERSSWPEQVQQLVGCVCAAAMWGLTDAGRQVAESLLIKLPPETMKRVDWQGFHATIRTQCDRWDDSDSPRHRDEED